MIRFGLEKIVQLQVSGFGFRVSGFGLRVSGFGFRVSGFGSRRSWNYSFLGWRRLSKYQELIHESEYSRGGIAGRVEGGRETEGK
jgi:hypothetical protein